MKYSSSRVWVRRQISQQTTVIRSVRIRRGKAVSHPLGVAPVTAGRDLGAPDRWIPRRFSPLDPGVVGHAERIPATRSGPSYPHGRDLLGPPAARTTAL